MDAVYNGGDAVVGAREHHRATSTGAKNLLCRPCYAEIEVRAPPPSNRLTMTTLPSSPALPTAAAAASVTGVPEGLAVVAPTAAAQ